ncbi:MAG TPA: M23 family metallopeptidase [Firmicutes bacterium]|nr:M23 family metallopeptidase [Bacillota bacterium]
MIMIKDAVGKLFNKYMTFIVLPHDEVGAKQKRVSYGTLALVLFFVLLFVGVSLVIIADYGQRKVASDTLNRLVYENTILKEKYSSLKKNTAMVNESIAGILNKMDNLLIMNNLPPTSEVMKEMGIGGSESASPEENLLIMDPGFKRQVQEISTMIVSTEKRVELAKQLLAQISSHKEMNSEMWDNIPTVWPVYGWITSGFGTRISPMTGKQEFHPGLDIAQNIGEEIVAPGDGVVIYAGSRPGWGRTVLIRHEYGIVTRYAHMDSIKVTLYQEIKKGDILGTVGNTGYSIGPHLHYEVRVHGTPVDPMNYILTRKD